MGGFENNTIAPITPLLVERYMDAAEALAGHAITHIDELAPCPAGQTNEQCARNFIDAFGRLAFRRPLEDIERDTLLAVYLEKASRSDYSGGIRLVLEMVLQSPQFLYRVEEPATTRSLTGFELATRLSYFIWVSTPDAALLDDAAAGRLSTPETLEQTARRMLKDPRATDGIRSFHRQWLGLRELETQSKEGLLSATFTPELRDAMVEETLRFAAHTVLSARTGGDAITTLLTSKKSFLNASLAKLYGAPVPSSDGFVLVDLPDRQRAGVLTHASVMTLLANADQTSPVMRGKFVREKLLCQSIPPPPPDVVTAAPRVDPKLTTKQRFAQHRTDRSCAGCHQLMDPIGFAFEHYDALGAWRSVDGAFAIDSVGELSSTDDADGAFDGAVELGARLAASQQVRRCIASQWFRFALGRAQQEEDAASLDRIYQTFARSGFDVRELIVAIATSHVFGHAGVAGSNR